MPVIPVGNREGTWKAISRSNLLYVLPTNCTWSWFSGRLCWSLHFSAPPLDQPWVCSFPSCRSSVFLAPLGESQFGCSDVIPQMFNHLVRHTTVMCLALKKSQNIFCNCFRHCIIIWTNPNHLWTGFYDWILESLLCFKRRKAEIRMDELEQERK